MKAFEDLNNTVVDELPSNHPEISAVVRLLSKQYIYTLRNNFFSTFMHGFESDFAIRSGSYLITRGSVANYLYDAVLDFCVVTKENAGNLADMAERFVRSTPLSEFGAGAVDALVCAKDVRYNYLLRRVIAITLDLYNRDYVMQVFEPLSGCTGTLKPSMYLGAFAVTSQQRTQYYRDLYKAGKLDPSANIPYLDTCWTKKEAALVYEKLYRSNTHLIQEMCKVPPEEVRDLIAWGIDQGTYSTVDAVFCSDDWSSMIYHFARYYVVSGFMERETADCSCSLIECGITQTFYDVITDFGVDCIKNRKLYIREKGVILNLTKRLQRVNKIMLQEYHNKSTDMHMMRIVYLADSDDKSVLDFAHGFTVNMKDLRMSGSFYGESDVLVLLAVLYWLGIDIDLSNHSVLSPMYSVIVDVMQEDNIHYEEPVSWNYNQFNSYCGSKANGKVYFIEKRNIGRYTRKLPLGEQASPAAKALARSVFMELKPGHTIVDEFERNQVVKKRSK